VLGLKSRVLARGRAVFNLPDAMRLYRCKSLEEVWEISFKIGMLGQYGLDESEPK
jgi:hypothetical protein